MYPRVHAASARWQTQHRARPTSTNTAVCRVPHLKHPLNRSCCHWEDHKTFPTPTNRPTGDCTRFFRVVVEISPVHTEKEGRRRRRRTAANSSSSIWGRRRRRLRGGGVLLRLFYILDPKNSPILGGSGWWRWRPTERPTDSAPPSTAMCLCYWCGGGGVPATWRRI